MKKVKIERRLYQGCGEVIVALRGKNVVQIMYKNKVIYCQSYGDFCDLQKYPTRRYTSKRLQEFKRFEERCAYRDLKLAKEEFKKANQGLVIAEGMASCGSVYIFN